MLATVDAPEISENGEYSQRYLRYAAGLYFTTDIRCGTIDQLQRHPVFQEVPLSTLYQWASRDKWIARREDLLNRWREMIEKKIGESIVQKRVKDLEKLERLFDVGFEQLEKNAVEAKSWEGVAGALVKLMSLMDELREKIATQLNPAADMLMSPAASPVAQMAPKVTDDEARAAAKLIIQQRRAGIRAKMAKGDDQTVVQGGD